ncbi:hypothetical protein BJX99DRAFT_256817 [Aspergillus californicus]
MSEPSEPRSGALPAADVAKVLDQAQVPNLLFGFWAVGLHGSDRAYPEIDFVIPDAKLQLSIDTLITAGLDICTKTDCTELRVDRCPLAHQLAVGRSRGPVHISAYRPILCRNRYHAIADAHFHLESRYTYYTVLSLYKQSEILWWLGDITLDPVGSDDATFMYSDDPRLPPRGVKGPTGPWTDLHPVKVLKQSLLAEALVLLMCRNYGDVQWVNESWKMMWFTLLELNLEPYGTDYPENIRALRRHIKAEFLPVVDGFLRRPGEGENIYRPLRQFRDKLLERNELPRLPEINLFGKI